MMNRPTMTKQHFIAIARAVFEMCLTPSAKEIVAGELATFCAQQNSNFDRERFMLACLEGKISARKGCTPR